MGDRAAYLAAAAEAIGRALGSVRSASSCYQTAAWGMEGQPDFLNQVLLIDTPLAPQALLDGLLGIEQSLGRFRGEKYGPRTIDLDILFYNTWIIALPGLQVPHPRIPERRFVLEPMVELAPGMRHPILHRTMRELLDACPDPLPVHKFVPAVYNKD
jgi:2-amino-4-hydroxy-6-hydroxymethyldihydropteridine diphosphokinase